MRRSVATSSLAWTLGQTDAHILTNPSGHWFVSNTPPPDGREPFVDDGPPFDDGPPVAPQSERASGAGRRPVAGRGFGVFRYAALGTELAAYTLVFAGIGYVIDRARGHQKMYVTAVATLIGFAYGMFRFVTEVQRGSK